MDEIRQNGKTVLYSEDGISIPMLFNNLSGKNFSGKDYEDYIRNIVSGNIGIHSGNIELYKDGRIISQGIIPVVKP